MLSNKTTSFFAGLGCGLCFAPVFFLPGIFLTSVLLAQIKLAKTKAEAAKFGYFFGFGFYLATLYWISFGVSVYIEQFWWAIPFALFGLPAFLALFTAVMSFSAWHFRNHSLFHFLFCCIWVLTEWVMSWIFTGLPWGVLAYGLSNWLFMIQIADIFSVFGLSFFAIYVGSMFYTLVPSSGTSSSSSGLTRGSMAWSKVKMGDDIGMFYSRLITSIIMIASVISYGIIKINNNPTGYLKISARIVQPSIPQTEKWDPDDFWQNLRLQIDLSKQKSKDEIVTPAVIPRFDEVVHNNKKPWIPASAGMTDEGAKDEIVPDLIVWSEAALTAPYYIKPVREAILSVLSNDRQVLITGGVGDNGKTQGELELYSSMIGFSMSSQNKPQNDIVLFEYHKAHLVPFGEYMPLKKILPLKKITHGLVDYTQGERENIYIDKFALNIWPLICYESIFPEEVRISNKNTDVIVNITNDAWYGNSSGPYQHLEISRMRAIENGLPLIRASNNGISAFIDPVGRVLSKTMLDDIVILDNLVPRKLKHETIFSKFGLKFILVGVFLVLILQFTSKYFSNSIYTKLK